MRSIFSSARLGVSASIASTYIAEDRLRPLGIGPVRIFVSAEQGTLSVSVAVTLNGSSMPPVYCLQTGELLDAPLPSAESKTRCMFPGFHGTIRAPSGMQLAWLPVANQAEEAAIAVLKELFAKHGPPLVLKSDNGLAFISDHFQSLLHHFSVAWLPSPPRKPGYNGGCEAGNGSLRKRTAHFARRTGRWTSGCLQAATAQANELLRPHGHRGPTHRECWSARNRSIRPCGIASPPRPNAIGKRSSASAKTSSVWKTKTINAKCNVRPCFEHSSNSTC